MRQTAFRHEHDRQGTRRRLSISRCHRLSEARAQCVKRKRRMGGVLWRGMSGSCHIISSVRGRARASCSGVWSSRLSAVACLSLSTPLARPRPYAILYPLRYGMSVVVPHTVVRTCLYCSYDSHVWRGRGSVRAVPRLTRRYQYRLSLNGTCTESRDQIVSKHFLSPLVAWLATQ